MEFFVCRSTVKGNVILDGQDQGPNQDASGKPLTMQCNAGVHNVSLVLGNGKSCTPQSARIDIKNTNPISPLEVPFSCE